VVQAFTELRSVNVGALFYEVPISGVDWHSRELLAVVLSLLNASAGRSGDMRQMTSLIEPLFACKPVLINSGRSALELALWRVWRHVGDRSRREILVPSLLCRAVPDKIVKCGFIPVFFDVDQQLSASPCAALQAITPNTVAIVFPYLYGKTVNIGGLAAACKERGIYLIEDCAASFLLRDNSGKLTGTTGDYAVFSFSVGKTLVAGAGGVLLDRTGISDAGADPLPAWSKSEECHLCLSKFTFILEYGWKTAAYIMSLTFGPRGRSFWKSTFDLMRPMPIVDARLVLAQARRWESIYARKCQIIQRYAANLRMSSDLRLPQYQPDGFVNRLFVQFPHPVLSRTENGLAESEVLRYLAKRGIQTQLSYYPLHRMQAFSHLFAGTLPQTDQFYESILEVPTQPTLKDAQIDLVSEALLNYAKMRRPDEAR